MIGAIDRLGAPEATELPPPPLASLRECDAVACGCDDPRWEWLTMEADEVRDDTI